MYKRNRRSWNSGRLAFKIIKNKGIIKINRKLNEIKLGDYCRYSGKYGRKFIK